jgi:dihydrofolate reductase
VRPVRYNVAASLDGYIAGPDGEYDWIPEDPTVDFAGLFAAVDTVLLGRHSYEMMRAQGTSPWPAGARVFVFSRTLTPDAHPGVTVVGDGAAETVAALRAEPVPARSGCSAGARCSVRCSPPARWTRSR